VKDKIRVLVVDDSGYVIAAVTKRLQADPDIEVIDSARNGIQAIEKVKSLKPDVVTMDVLMPEMDGLEALKYIMAECPTPVIMLSALTSEHAETTIRALEYGAVDFYLKPSAIRPDGNGSGDGTLITKLKMAARLDVTGKGLFIPFPGTPKKKKPSNSKVSFNRLVVISSSTGGPRALMQLIPSFPEDISAAILIVQHMPPMFTKSLAERLQLSSKINVMEAQDGDEIKKGLALIAPGDHHMIVNSNGQIRLNQDPPVCGVRPSANITMKSGAEYYKDKTLGVVLTGMGSDGTDGALYIKELGGQVLVQNEASCAVYGMPSSVVNAGGADKILSLPEMTEEIIQACNNQEQHDD
jgi:two-component system chemotaxis response regulator CheB